ncbi:sensor histidine kinase [Cupriavidus plantarum]|uniref:sensor histidine kinase n=1 Tax=Cupriavidus plantarum TaxID=942865 RepID=UPI0015CB9712|nr:ATP-binding protein [Cupriavidus plantarum]NYI01717.1 signal transduction histidine kinase [Cupriavidus plantarum]
MTLVHAPVALWAAVGIAIVLAAVACVLGMRLRAMRREVRRQRAAFARLQDMLAHVSRLSTLGEMAASIAHELRQPLAAISLDADASLRWLSHEAVNLKEVSDGVERIRDEALRAERVVRGLRALSLRSCREVEPLSLQSAWEETLPLVPLSRLSHVGRMDVDIDPSLPDVLADRVQIQQVMLNLLTNALQAVASSVPSLAVGDTPQAAMRTGHLRVRAYRSAEDEPEGPVWFEIADNGAGIDPRHLSRVFEPFFTTRPDGMGMGLVICQRLVEAHGGAMTIRSRDGWTTVAFSLPALPRDPSNPSGNAPGDKDGEPFLAQPALLSLPEALRASCSSCCS